jgi:hypothetical protein
MNESKQRRWQKAMLDEGRCKTCGRKWASGSALFCRRHLAWFNRWQRNRYRRRVGIPTDAPLRTRALSASALPHTGGQDEKK